MPGCPVPLLAAAEGTVQMQAVENALMLCAALADPWKKKKSPFLHVHYSCVPPSLRSTDKASPASPLASLGHLENQ